jgi:hypothetical protein
MLQSITVFLLVFTMMKGRCIVVLARGAPFSSSTFLFLFTKFLNAICYRKISMNGVKNTQEILIQETRFFVLINNLPVKLVLVVAQFFVESLPTYPFFPSVTWKLLWDRHRIEFPDKLCKCHQFPKEKIFYDTSRCWHSCAEFVGKPIHLISFFSFDMIFIAIRTLRAS